MGLQQGLSTGNAAVDGLVEGELGALRAILGPEPQPGDSNTADINWNRVLLGVLVGSTLAAAITAAAVLDDGKKSDGEGTDEDEDEETDTDDENGVHGGDEGGGNPWILW